MFNLVYLLIAVYFAVSAIRGVLTGALKARGAVIQRSHTPLVFYTLVVLQLGAAVFIGAFSLARWLGLTRWLIESAL